MRKNHNSISLARIISDYANLATRPDDVVGQQIVKSSEH